MEQTTKHNGSYRWIRWPLYFLAGLLALVLLLRIALITGPVHQWVRSQIVSSADSLLNVSLSIDKLSGDLWNEVRLTGITLSENDTTVASVDTLYLKYGLLSYLSDVFQIEEIHVSDPYLKLHQNAQGEWNVATWMKPTDQDTTSGFPFRIDRLAIRQGRIDARLNEPADDATFRVEDLRLSGSLGLYRDDFEASLSELSFRVTESRLPTPLTVSTSAQTDGQSFTLEQLVIATGNTLIRSSGQVSLEDSTARASVLAKPLSWRDLVPYVKDLPIRDNINFDLDVQGNLKRFNIALNIAADGIENFTAAAEVEWDSTLILTGARLRAQELNLTSLLGDTTLPRIRNLEFRTEGKLPVDAYRQADLRGTFSIGLIQQGPYRVQQTGGSLRLADNLFRSNIRMRQQAQQVDAEIRIEDLWSKLPSTSLHVQASDINPGYWLKNARYNGRISLQADITGRGLAPSDTTLWDYALTVADSRIGEYDIRGAEIQGRFSTRQAVARSAVRLGEGVVNLDAGVRDLQTLPRFTYELGIRGLNLAALGFTDDLDTSLNGSIHGEGQGNSLETLRLASTIRLDTSMVNQELVESLKAQLHVADSIATLEDAELQSAIAAGTIGARIHLMRWYNPANELNFDIHLKDVDALAPLAGVEKLQLDGELQGKLIPAGENNLRFTSEIDLSDVNYNDVFLAQWAQGNIDVLLQESPEYSVDVSLTAPVVSSVELQNLDFTTQGTATPEGAAAGDFRLEFRSTASEGRIVHSGVYQSSGDSTLIHTNQLELSTSLRTLNLTDPFDIRVAGSAVRMDTMRIQSDDGASLALSAAYIDSLHQQGYLAGNELNLTIIQELILGKAYLNGILSGTVQVQRADTALTALGDLVMADLEWRGTSFDTLALNLEVAKNEFEGGLRAIYKDQKLIEGQLNVPFRLGDPATFSESFYQQPVRGHLRMNEVPLSQFDELLEQAGLANTGGVLEFSSQLEGTAGNPDFTGQLSLKKATLSGVEVDSVLAQLDYNHDASQLALAASVRSLGQKAADIRAEIPFGINLKTFEVMFPEQSDSLFVDVETNDFNLAALNDFVNRQQVRDIRGLLNGNVRIRGPQTDLKARGKLTLNDGAFRIVPAGIDVSRIRTTLSFEPDTVRLLTFRAISGRGYMDAKGTVELTQLAPGDMDLQVEARNFRIANTSEYSAVINLDTRIDGTPIRPRVVGELAVINGFIELTNFGEKSIEEVELDDSETAEPDTVSIYNALRLDMDVSFNRRFFVRNERYLELEIELDGQVDLIKREDEELQMFGTMGTAGGYAKPLGKRFELVEGSITFTGDPTNPQLDVRTLYEPPQAQQEVKIWYIIEGTVEDPQFKYESQPPMELENIISYTLFGQPFYALDSWKQVLASSGSSNTTVADVALDVLLDRVESLATERLGIDVVRIENTRVGNESGTAITTGWYLNPKVFFAIQNVITGSSPDTSFLLEYLLKENLKLIIFQGENTRQGIDLKWSFDY